VTHDAFCIAPRPPSTATEKKSQQQLLERYDDALRQRARERRIELPAWQ